VGGRTLLIMNGYSLLPEALEVFQLLCEPVLLVLHLSENLLQHVEIEGDLKD
jgi:hypothetical protein